MRKGGYQIIDLHDTNFTAGGAAMMIDGIHEKIEGSYRKPILMSGLTIGGVEYPDAYVEMKVNESAYTTTAYGYDIKIENTDAVTITVAAG